MATFPTISALPTAPSRGSPSTFNADAEAFVAALATLRSEINAFGAAGNSFTSNDVRERVLLTIADDAVATITPTDNGGALMMIANHNTVNPQLNRSSIIGYDVGTTPD